MAKPNKTIATTGSVATIVNAIADPKRRQDCVTLIGLMEAATGRNRRWGTPSSSGSGVPLPLRERPRGHVPARFSPQGRCPLLPRAPAADQLERLGKHKTGKGCLYIGSLEDIHLPTLTALLKKAAKGKPAGATSQ
jgi:hypothetical protein